MYDEMQAEAGQLQVTLPRRSSLQQSDARSALSSRQHCCTDFRPGIADRCHAYTDTAETVAAVPISSRPVRSSPLGQRAQVTVAVRS